MNSFGRLLLRFLLVPLGFLAAALAAALVVFFAFWGETTASRHPDASAFAAMAWLVAGPAVLQFIITFMPLPASIGILISDAFAIRSWIFHVFNGIVTAWLGCQFYVTVTGMHMPLFRHDPPPSLPATTR